MKRYLALLLSVVMILSLGITAYADNDKDKDVLRVAANAEASTLDPSQTTDASSQQIFNNIFETLVYEDENQNIVGKLAESYEQVDDTTYVFHLRQGIMFTNGEELKASDVVFTYTRNADSPKVASYFRDVESVTATGDYEVEIKLTQPSAPFLTGLTFASNAIVNEKAITEAGDNAGTQPVGTGPYKLQSWNKGVKLTLERNEEYWGEKPVFRTVEVVAVPESTNRTIELESGNVDIALEIPETDHNRVRETEGLQLLEQPARATTLLGMNCSKAPLDDVRVRQAISHALDIPTIVKAIKGDAVQVAYSEISSQMKYYKEETDSHVYDVEKAKELLKEAGYEDGFEISVLCDEKKENLDIATIVQQLLQQVGIKVKINTMEFATMCSEAYAGNSELFIVGWGSGTMDPDTVLFSCFHSSNAVEGGNNWARFVNPECDALLEKSRVVFDDAERGEVYAEIQDLLAEECPWINIWERKYFVGIGGNVESMVMDPNSCYSYYKVK
ncbi:MAG: ABC transporter substrate-binding protein [Oscillospiraceae bacterium]|nr:ABC transporter substrate-binding protein [Oscillospiraceae bacterium]